MSLLCAPNIQQGWYDVVICMAHLRKEFDDQFVMLRRRKEKFWTCPSGKIEKGETPGQACVRETFEEVGWHVSVADGYPEAILDHSERKQRLHYYDCKYTSGETILKEPDKFDWLKILGARAIQISLMQQGRLSNPMCHELNGYLHTQGMRAQRVVNAFSEPWHQGYQMFNLEIRTPDNYSPSTVGFNFLPTV